MRFIRPFLIMGVIVMIAGHVFAQPRRNSRVQQRRDLIIGVGAAAREAREAELAKAAAVPKPKPAVTNVDVQLVFAREEFKSFAEAARNAAEAVSDGEKLWLYLRFNGKLGDYVFAIRDPENENRLRYLLFAEIGPRGDATIQNQYLLEFNKDDLPKSELRINLAPGLPGRNASIPVFLSVAGSRGPGLWYNELRLSNAAAIPRPPNENLAVSPIILDLSKGSGTYRKMLDQYDSLVMRGTTDSAQLPIPGLFYSLPIKTRVIAKLSARGVAPARFYFSGDQWMEMIDFSGSMTRTRKVFAVFTYRKTQQCFYGVAEVIQKFDFESQVFRDLDINLQIGFPLPCRQL